MTKKRVILIVLAVLLAGVLGVLLVIDSRYKVLFSSPRVSHETIVSPQKTRGILTIDVPKAKSLIERKVKAPGLALSMALPYEAALLVDVDRGLGDVAMKIFINDKRLAPAILQFAEKIMPRLTPPYDSWFKQPMRQEKRGVLLLEGNTACGRQMRQTIGDQWKDAEVDKPLKVRGGHFIEAVLDNRDGSALAFASVLCDSQNRDLTQVLNEMVLGFLAGISDYRIQADLVSDTQLAVKLIVECAPNADPNLLPILQGLIDGGLAKEKTKTSAQALGITYQGTVNVEGNTVVADYKVNIEKLLARL